jgi:hypothetical protein
MSDWHSTSWYGCFFAFLIHMLGWHSTSWYGWFFPFTSICWVRIVPLDNRFLDIFINWGTWLEFHCLFYFLLIIFPIHFFPYMKLLTIY